MVSGDGGHACAREQGLLLIIITVIDATAIQLAATWINDELLI